MQDWNLTAEKLQLLEYAELENDGLEWNVTDMSAHDLCISPLLSDGHTTDQTICVPVTFYRTTLCLSAVFAVARCLSVCLSVTLAHCIYTAKDIVKPFRRLGSPITLVFLAPASIPNSKGNPYSGGAKHKVVGKFAIFD